ncbi:hypothetical protein QTP88_020927 [Uroleucon formosanum]
MQKHRTMSYGFIVKASENVLLELLKQFGIPTEPVIYRGSENKQDVAKHFMESIVDVSEKIEKLLTTNSSLIMTYEDITRHTSCFKCNLCKCDVNSRTRIRDHDHLTGKFRQTLYNSCNLSLKQPKYVPVFLHNLSNYDAHFIVTELGYDSHRIKIIPNSEEKFLTFSKYISNNFTIRFVDTFRFMATGLSTLATNLITSDLDKFRIIAKHFSNNDLPLVTRKGLFPYDFTDDWSKLEQTTLPIIEDFYSILTKEHIKDTEYQFAKDVWSHFNCRMLGEYSDLYLKIDVLLLADVFDNFRDLCLNTYNLDPAYYFTAPGFSFDAMLKYSIKLELLSDYEMLLMFENGIRGGLTQASMRYAKSNNERTPDYNPRDPKSWLVYQDCNNLYGWAMSQCMPYGGFNWVEPSLAGLEDLNDTSPIGRIYEVDIAYPEELHDKHSDLPFLPQNSIPSGSKVRKLMATFKPKKNYIVHYRNLQQALNNGLIVEKVHRVIQFKQSPWLASYIALNTEMRKKAKNAFEKNFFKLLNNAVFGLAVLGISKSLMYDYHYNVMQKHYGDKIELIYTDIDSLVYYIQTDDFYEDLKNNPSLLDRMDTSNLPENHPCFISERKKIPGLFSDQTDGFIMAEFCALRAKSYAYILAGREKIRAKRENISIRSFKHQLMTIKSNKLTFNNFDDKRVILEDKNQILAHGHYSIEEYESEVEWLEDEEGGKWNEEEKGLMRELLKYADK